MPSMSVSKAFVIARDLLPDPDRMMSTAEAAALIARSHRYVRDLVRHGELPAVRATRAKQARIIVRRADVLAWLDARTIGPEAPKSFPAPPHDCGGRFAKA